MSMKEAQGIIDSNLHFDLVRFLVEGKTNFAAVTFLREKGYETTYEAVKDFRFYFFEPLYAILRLEMEKEAEDRSKHVATAFVRLTRVEVLVDLIRRTSRQIDILESKEVTLTGYERSILTTFYDKILEYRKALEETRLASEVEIAREKGIELVVGLALQELKDFPDRASRFVESVQKHVTKTKEG